MNQNDLNKKVHLAMNEQGEKLTADGVLGPVSLAAMSNYDFTVAAKKIIAMNPTVDLTDLLKYFNAPWVFPNLDLLGLNETDPRLNARYAPEWKFEGLNYKDLIGNSHPWCSVCANADCRCVGVNGTNSAAASSWDHYGDSCPFWFGAFLPIEHASGGRHICRFLYWIDKANMIAATLDGNKGNKFAINRTDISGKNGADRVKTTPRWPHGWSSGMEVSMADVLAARPMLKVGGSGSSTT